MPAERRLGICEISAMHLKVKYFFCVLAIISGFFLGYFTGYASGIRDGRWSIMVSNSLLAMLKFRLLSEGNVADSLNFEKISAEDGVYAFQNLKESGSPLFIFFMDNEYINEITSKKLFTFIKKFQDDDYVCDSENTEFNQRFSVNISKCKKRVKVIKKFIEEQAFEEREQK